MSKKEKINPFYYQKAADRGDADAMCIYAELLYKGKEIPINKRESARYFRGAADQGNIKAMINYANIIGKGDGVPVDKKESAKYFKMAADKGEVNAMFYYAQISYRGDGIPVNKLEAAKYYKMAAHAGKRDAMHNYAIMAYKGDGIQIKKPKAARYFKMAADKGQIQAMLYYAQMLSEGDEIPVDKNEAARYFKMAADKGNKDAKNKYKELQNDGYGISNDKNKPDITNKNIIHPPAGTPDNYRSKSIPNQASQSQTETTKQNQPSKTLLQAPKKKEPEIILPNRNKSRRATRSRRKNPPSRRHNQQNLESKPQQIENQSQAIPNSSKITDGQPEINEDKPKANEKLPNIHLNDQQNAENATIPEVVQSQLPKIDLTHPNEPENQPQEATDQKKSIEQLPNIDNTQPNIAEDLENVNKEEIKTIESQSDSDKPETAPQNQLQVIKPHKPPEETFEISYDNTESGKFRGIIHYLTEKCGGNVHHEGIVNVTSSSVFPNRPSIPIFFFLNDNDSDYNPYNCVDLDDEKSCFESDNLPNSWICYDFKNLKVRPNMYSIRTYMNGHNHMRNWCIEASNDNTSWTTLDEQKDQTILDGVGKSSVFTLTANGEFYRYLRLRQTGPTKNGMNILNVSALEFFGTAVGSVIASPRRLQQTQRQQMRVEESSSSSDDSDSFVARPLDDVPDEPFEIEYDDTESGRFRGIIHYLSEKCGGNVHKEGAVEVTSSSVIPQSVSLLQLLFSMKDDYNPYNCVDLDDAKTCFESADKPDSWICYDFQNLKVRPNKYSIRSYLNGDNHLQEWVIEGSNDKKNWTTLDERKDEESLNDTGKSNTFTINEGETEGEFYRYLRLRQTGRSTIGSHVISISALEFFGSIVLSDKSFLDSSAGQKRPKELPQKDGPSAPRKHLSRSSSSSSSSSRDEQVEYKLIETIDEPRDIPYDGTDGGRFRGVISHLSSKCGGGNVHEEGLVEVTSSSVYPKQSQIPIFLFLDDDPDYNPYNCVDFDDAKTCFESDNLPNSWICYDFQELKVRPNKYSIRSYLNGDNHLQDWVIEGSNDKKNWTTLDERKDEESLNDTGKSNTFTINEGETEGEFYRYLRLRQTGRSTIGSHVISISALEFFGSIVGKISQAPKREKKQPKKSEQKQQRPGAAQSSFRPPSPPEERRSRPRPRKRRREESDDSDSFVARPLDDVPDEPFEIEYDDTESGRFRGIIHYLSEKCGGNVHKEGAVEVTSSSVIPSISFLSFLGDDDDDYNPYNCVDLDDPKTCFESNDEPDSWICYDFQNLKVRPNSYSIRTYLNGDNHLQTWCIEGSNDKRNWITLDQRFNEKSLNDTGKSSNFKIDNNDDYFRFLRLRQTGKTTEGMNILNLSALEFFGSLYCRISVVY